MLRSRIVSLVLFLRQTLMLFSPPLCLLHIAIITCSGSVCVCVRGVVLVWESGAGERWETEGFRIDF